MTNIRIIPVLSLHNSGLVKTVKFSNPKYIGDPINAVRIFNDKEVDELVFLDITASSLNHKPNFKIIEEVASECFMPLSYGGGISNINEVKTLFSLGVEKVIFNSIVSVNPRLVKEVSDIYGSQSIVVSVDVKKNFLGKYEAYTHSGSKKINRSLKEYISEINSLGIGELILNSIDNDGLLKGYDLALISTVSKLVDIPVVALGGASNLNDFRMAVDAGAHAVAASSFFVYHGKHKAVLISYPTKEQILKLFI